MRMMFKISNPQLMQRFKTKLFLFTLMLACLGFSFGQKKDTARVLDPDQEFYKQGMKLIDSANYKEAIKVFQKALKINKTFFQAVNKIAYCKVQLKDLSGAEKDLLKSLKLQGELVKRGEAKEDPGTIKYLGYVYLEDRKYDDAKIYLDSAAKLSKDDPELEFFIGSLKMTGNDLKGALVCFENAIFLKENYGVAYLKRGLVYFKQRNYKLAIRDLTKGLELSPADSSNVQVFRARADANYEMGDYNGSVRDYSRILVVEPKNEEAYAFRGAAKIELQDYSGAIDDETKAIELNKNSFVAYNFRGVAKGGLKQGDKAIEDLDMAIKIKPDYASAFVNRASVRYAKGEKKKACADLERADRLGSDIAYKYIEAYCKNLQGQK
jgi:tetratricopeptide (TPR) repeat protein